MRVTMVNYFSTIKVYLKYYFAYPLNVFIKLIYVPVQLYIMYFLWQTLSEYQTLDINYLMNYYLLAFLILYSYPYLHIASEVNEDILSGVLSNYLVRPISFITPKLSKFISWMLMYSIVIFIALTYIAFQNNISFLRILQFLILMTIGLLIEFHIWFLIGLLAFYIGKVRGIMILTGSLRSLLSGSLIPLSLFPEWSMGILQFSPFRFFLYTPVNFLLTDSVSFSSELLSALICLIVLLLLEKIIWKSGSKLYNNSMS